MIGASGHDAVPIGDVSAPPFARLPDPSRLFGERSMRFRQLVSGHPLAPYLSLLSDLAAAQHEIQLGLPEPALPSDEMLARSREFGMPALDRSRFTSDPVWDETLRRFLDGVAGIDMPAEAKAALSAVAAGDDETRAWMARNVLEDSIPFGEIAEHVFVAAALQVHAARAAARLDPAGLAPVGEGACPSCGSPPASSLVVGWEGAHGARFCSCALCATLWHHVRIKCTACGSTKGIGYQELDGTSGAVKAETCDECRTYLKIMHQTKEHGLDPVADDVATSALDILVSETGLRRSGANPFLLGY